MMRRDQRATVSRAGMYSFQAIKVHNMSYNCWAGTVQLSSLHPLLGSRETLLGLLPVDDLPNVLEVVNLDVLVVEVEGVLPDVNAEDGNVGWKLVNPMVGAH